MLPYVYVHSPSIFIYKNMHPLILISLTAVFIRPVSAAIISVTDIWRRNTSACVATCKLVFTTCFTHMHKHTTVTQTCYLVQRNTLLAMTRVTAICIQKKNLNCYLVSIHMHFPLADNNNYPKPLWNGFETLICILHTRQCSRPN